MGCPTPLHALNDYAWTMWLHGFTWLSYLFLLFPDAASLSWDILVLFGLTSVLVFWVLEGAWWTFFRWLKSLTALGLYHWITLLAAHREQYLFRRDVRFTFKAPLSVILTGHNTVLFCTTWHKRSSAPHHHQFLVHVRLRLRYQREHEPTYQRTSPNLPTQKEHRFQRERKY